DGRFHVRYPASLLGLPLPRPSAEVRPNELERLTFLNHPAVREYIIRTEYLPLYNYNDSVCLNWLDGLVLAFLQPSAHVSLHGFLSSFADREPFERQPVPRLVTRYVERRPFLLEQRRNEVLDWVRAHLDARCPALVESAIRVAFAMGFHEDVLTCISRHGGLLFGAGRIDLLQRIVGRYLDSEFRIPSRLFIIAANIAAGENRLDEGLALLDRGKSFYEGLEYGEADFGDLALATGETLRLSGRLTESMAEFSLARECFVSAKLPAKIAEADDALGRLMIARDRPEAARRYFLSALSSAWSSRSTHEQAGILENLGLVEHDLGNPRRAVLYLSRAVSLHSLLGNRPRVASATLSLGMMHLAMGHLTKAFRLFKDVHASMEKIGNTGGSSEAAAYLGWTCDLLGKQGAADSWWAKIPSSGWLEPRIRATVELLRARRRLLHDDIRGALSAFQTLFSDLQGIELSSSEFGDISFGIGVCMAILGTPDAPSMLSSSLDRMAGTPHRVQTRQSRIFAGLVYPDLVPARHVFEEIRLYPKTNGFDPFWYFYAAPLAAVESIESSTLLDHHIGKTPPDLLAAIRNRHPSLSHLLDLRDAAPSRAAQFVTLIRSGLARPMHIDDYTNWRQTDRFDSFTFDGPSGELRFGRNTAALKPGSILHKILIQLFLAFPNPVDAASLYTSAWGLPYDPECDQAAFKSAILRLNGTIRAVYPGASLSRPDHTSAGGTRHVALSLPGAWEAVI
ncbi:tetratricopeptide repeat protein, partial [Candidatus Ozemobacteraceae bacterium]|nr:tetratricopeptide repeat protein [Candidatus Ozemobacteraceae bacterium]